MDRTRYVIHLYATYYLKNQLVKTQITSETARHRCFQGEIFRSQTNRDIN